MSAKVGAMTVLLAIIALAAFIRWSEWRSAEADAVYARYAQCVEDTYGVSVTRFYQIYGYTPTCGA